MTINFKIADQQYLRRILAQQFSYKHEHFGLAESELISRNPLNIQRMLLTEEFVSRVLKTNEPAWHIQMTSTRFMGADLTKTGESFYHMLQEGTPITDIPNYELGLRQQLFNDVAIEMDLRPGLLKRQAFYQTDTAGPNEGVYVNSMIERIRKLGHTAKFEQAVNERQKEAKRHHRESKKLITRLSATASLLCGQWVTLEYFAPATVSPQQSDMHLNRFRGALQDASHQVDCIGLIWARHFLPETGFRIRILFLNEPKTLYACRNDWIVPLSELWAYATKGGGKITLDPILLGPDAVDRELQALMQAETIVRLSSDTWKNFGCFDSSFAPGLVLPRLDPNLLAHGI